MNSYSADKRFMAVALWKQQFTQFKDSNKSLSQLLISGELVLADYMKWATENYKLPFLNDNFFAQTNNHKLILENPHAQWSEFFFPIHEWQGMLYVGCLEPQTLSLTKKHCLVLCSPTQLSALWGKMQKPAAATTAPATPIVPPQAAPKITPPPLAVPVGTPSTVLPSAPKAPTAAPKTVIVAPAPITAPASPQNIAPTPKPAPVSAPKPPADPLSGLSKFRLEDTKSEVSTQVHFKAPVTQTDVKMQTPTPTTTNTADKTVIPTSHLKSQGVNMNPSFTESNYNIPEITNVVRASKPKSNDTNFTSTKTIMPFPDRTTQFTFIRTVYSDQVIIEAKAKIQENTDPQDALISAFRILKDYYKKLMWVVRDQKGYAFPIACNAEWEFTEEAWNLSMDFKTPNPFRIAKLTQKPYHGAIVKNRASDQFFKQWGDGSYPDVMSIVPVKLDGKVFGYFVGCEKGPHFQNSQSIELMESVCNELIVAFIRIHRELAKAS